MQKPRDPYVDGKRHELLEYSFGSILVIGEIIWFSVNLFKFSTELLYLSWFAITLYLTVFDLILIIISFKKKYRCIAYGIITFLILGLSILGYIILFVRY